MKQLSCAEFKELAPEFVFGLLDGADRVAAVAHLTICADCRGYVAELSATADALLLIGPEAEPPSGFEALVADRLRRERPRTDSRWHVLAAAAAAAVIGVVALSIGVYAGRSTAPQQALRRAPIVNATGEIGEVFLHQGDEKSWCYVSLTGAPNDGVYDVLATLKDGQVVVVERVSVRGGHGYYGKPLRVDADDIVRMTIDSVDGSGSYWADLST
ncbi:MAG: zf-HC2 domain-containing protein [Mycobacteriales bacterium]